MNNDQSTDKDQTLRNETTKVDNEMTGSSHHNGNVNGSKKKSVERDGLGMLEEITVSGNGQKVGTGEYMKAVIDGEVAEGDSSQIEYRTTSTRYKPHFKTQSMLTAMVSDTAIERASILGLETAISNVASISGKLFQSQNAIGLSDTGQVVGGNGCCRRVVTLGGGGNYEHGNLTLPTGVGRTNWRFLPSSYCNIKPTSTLQHEALAEESSYIRKSGGEAQFGRMAHGDQDIWNMRRVMVRGHAIGNNDYLSHALDVLGFMRGTHFNTLVESGKIPITTEETEACRLRIKEQKKRLKEAFDNACSVEEKKVAQLVAEGDTSARVDREKVWNSVLENDAVRPVSEGRIAVIGEQQLLRHYTALEENAVLAQIAPNRAWERLDDENRYVVMVTQNQMDNAVFIGGLILLLCGGEETGSYGNWGEFDHAARLRWDVEGNKQVIFVVEGSASKKHRLGGSLDLQNDMWYDYYEVFNSLLVNGLLPTVSSFRSWRLADYMQALSIWSGNVIQFGRNLSRGEKVGFEKKYPGEKVSQVLYKWWEVSPRVQVSKTESVGGEIGIWRSPFWVRWAETVGYVTTRYLSFRAFASIEGPRLLDFARVQAVSMGAAVDALGEACNIPMGYVGTDASNHCIKEALLQRLAMSLAKHLVTSPEEGADCVYQYGALGNSGVVPSGWVPWMSESAKASVGWRYQDDVNPIFTIMIRQNWGRWVPNLWYKGSEVRLDPEKYYQIENANEDESGRLFVTEGGLAKSTTKKRLQGDPVLGGIWSTRYGDKDCFFIRNVASGERFSVCVPDDLTGVESVVMPVLLPQKSHGEMFAFVWDPTIYKETTIGEKLRRKVLVGFGPEVDSDAKVWGPDGDLSFV